MKKAKTLALSLVSAMLLLSTPMSLQAADNIPEAGTVENVETEGTAATQGEFQKPQVYINRSVLIFIGNNDPGYGKVALDNNWIGEYVKFTSETDEPIYLYVEKSSGVNLAAFTLEEEGDSETVWFPAFSGTVMLYGEFADGSNGMIQVLVETQ